MEKEPQGQKRKTAEGFNCPKLSRPEKPAKIKESATIFWWPLFAQNGVKHRTLDETSVVPRAITFGNKLRGGKKAS